MLANSLYASTYAAFVFADGEAYKLLLNHGMHLSMPYIAPLWMLLAYKLRNSNRKIPLSLAIGLMVIPLIAMISNFFYQPDGAWYETLYYTNHTVQISLSHHWNGYTIITYEKGILYYVLIGYSLLTLAWATLLFYQSYRKGEFLAKTRSFILFTISFVGYVLLALALVNHHTAFIDYTPFFTALFAFVLFFTLFHYELFELVPKAYQLVFMQSQNPIFILDSSFQIIRMNPQAKRIFCDTCEDKPQETLNHMFTDIKFSFESMIKGNMQEIEWMMNQEKRFFSLEVTVLKNAYFGREYNGYCLTCYDITHQKKEMEIMERMATYDDLTKIYNRRYFYRLATEAFDNAQIEMKNIVVVMFDLDDFKIVNDIYGHQAGDYVLEELASLLKSKFPENGIFARYGGEEFIYMATDITIQAIHDLITTICSDVSTHPFIYSGRKLKITASFGASGSHRLIEKSLETYIKEADDMLYCAKGNGKNQVFFTKDIQ